MKGLLAEGGLEAIIGGSAALGPEAIAAEIAVMGMILGIKKLS
jgi:hypothetical protein